MNPILSYRFPLDSLEDQQIISPYDEVKVSAGPEDLKIDFDTRKGSFLVLKSNNSIHFAFDGFIIEPGKSYVINLFFNYEALPGTMADDSFLDIDDRYSLPIRNNCLYNEPLIPNTWYNVTVTLSGDKIKTMLFDKEIGSVDFSLGSVGKLKLQAGKNFNIKVSDVSIQEEVNAFALEKIRNYQNINSLPVFGTIKFLLYNEPAYKDRLFLDNHAPDPVLDIDFDPYTVEFHPDQQVHLILKTKKGFFKPKENFQGHGSLSTDPDDFFISLKAGQAMVNPHRLSVPVPSVELVNLRDQDRMLVQLELMNCTLKTADHSTTVLSGGRSVTLDQAIPIQDNRGAGVCPFEVFVFGNDTLYNGGNVIRHTVSLRIMNSRGEAVRLESGSSFDITSGQMEILKEDALQAVNIKIKNRAGQELKTVKDQKLRISLKEDITLAENQWIDLEISGVQAKNDSVSFPSGSYPFYLEYRNILGYRNGRARFYLRTGKIFYYQQ